MANCWPPFWIPFAPVVDAGWNEILRQIAPVPPNGFFELIRFQLPSGVDAAVIPFAVPKASAKLVLSGPMIVNTVDSNPLTGLAFTITNLSTSAVSLALNAKLDSDNYFFVSVVAVVG